MLLSINNFLVKAVSIWRVQMNAMPTSLYQDSDNPVKRII